MKTLLVTCIILLSGYTASATCPGDQKILKGQMCQGCLATCDNPNPRYCKDTPCDKCSCPYHRPIFDEVDQKCKTLEDGCAKITCPEGEIWYGAGQCIPCGLSNCSTERGLGCFSQCITNVCACPVRPFKKRPRHPNDTV